MSFSLQGHCPAAARAIVPDSHSSYKDYPVQRPLILRLVHHTPETRTHHPCRSSSPSKAIPETSSEGTLNFCAFASFPLRCCRSPWLHVQPDAAALARLSCLFILSHCCLSFHPPPKKLILYRVTRPVIAHDLSRALLFLHLQRSYLHWGTSRRKSGDWSRKKGRRSLICIAWGEMCHTHTCSVIKSHRHPWIIQQPWNKRQVVGPTAIKVGAWVTGYMLESLLALSLDMVYPHPQCWSPTWLLQSLAVRSWSGSWTSWGGSWPVRFVLVPVALHADTFLYNRNKRCDCSAGFRQRDTENGCGKEMDWGFASQESALVLVFREQ